jgi:phosphoglycolate phosphatase
VSPGSLIVFDLDGTLVDATLDLTTAINLTLRDLRPSLAPFSPETVRAFVGEGAARLVRKALEAVGLEDRAEAALPLFLGHYRDHLLDETRLYPGIPEALETLGGTPLAVLTNKPGDLSRRLLEGLGVAHRFGRILGGGDVPSRKPDPGGLLELVKGAGLAPAAALMVGDTAIDVRTGRAAGTRTAGVLYGFDAEGCRAEGPDLLLSEPWEIGTLSPAPL